MEYLMYYLAAVNIALCVMMGADKLCAKMHKRRIPERTLFAAAIAGGALGGTVGMYSFRHKTRHTAFAVGFPLLTVVQIALVIFLIAKLNA